MACRCVHSQLDIFVSITTVFIFLGTFVRSFVFFPLSLILLCLCTPFFIECYWYTVYKQFQNQRINRWKNHEFSWRALCMDFICLFFFFKFDWVFQNIHFYFESVFYFCFMIKLSFSRFNHLFFNGQNFFLVQEQLIDEASFSGLILPSPEWNTLDHIGKNARITYR